MCLMKPIALLLTLWLVAGCASTQTIDKTHTPPRIAGYAALYDLTSRNAGITRLLIFKTVDPPVKRAVTDFARQCAEAAKQIKRFADDDSRINLKTRWLTPIGERVRSGIETATSTALLTTVGRDFQTYLLLSQIDAAQYGSHLAKVLAKLDDNPTRRAYLRDLSDRLNRTRRRLFKLLESPSPKLLKKP